ncbi:uncharacterized protein MELLADRAFT_90226 [Melampsora larici-populina 98AG31]|uniref:AP complex mu/sigma subunit domain-containing protein n=1 Tax=Melampsora larici-populina (strain 98AG31 / pathotype 3-4-7) TaxID=747676 RepID=F4RW62_MELLP|nr:uncharacterized protein MELLADRAFT_90226 [Melampsora larici-populina 98AG31]EGG03373.1 hypothetical protein MELLADRAFT_90226 [Melampsora larici-populina 98AG31]
MQPNSTDPILPQCLMASKNSPPSAPIMAHLFVELLGIVDAYLGNVCELDLFCQSYRVYLFSDEVFLAIN